MSTPPGSTDDPAEPATAPEPVIATLSEALSNQIAAGEVVARPASVVKELVENALDAGATQITVDIREGGTLLIRVVDNGHGMSRANAERCVQRHATSKISRPDDLLNITTLGFRGEALPSIASIARFELVTCATGAAVGTCVQIDGGQSPTIRDAGAPEGTRIEVKDLFYNVPARRKFLKSVATEFSHIKRLLEALGLGFPYAHFTLTHNGKRALSYPAARSLRDRAYQVLGKKTAAHLRRVQASGDLQIEGLISDPSSNRGSRSGIFAFVNGRFVRDRVITHALVSAYGDTLPKGRFPEAVLYIYIPFDKVDVNAHPTKEEVRFSQPGAVHQAVASAVSATLRSDAWSLVPRDVQVAPPRPAPVAFETWAPAHPAPWVPGPPLYTPKPSHADLEEAAAPTPLQGWRFLGITTRGQAVVEEAQGLRIIELQAARECVAFAHLSEELALGQVAGRPLLFPTPLEVSADEGKGLKAHEELIAQLGFEVEPFGFTNWQCHGLPATLADQQPEVLLAALLQAVTELTPRSVDLPGRFARVIAKGCRVDASCAEELLDDLERLPNAAWAGWALFKQVPLEVLSRQEPS